MGDDNVNTMTKTTPAGVEAISRWSSEATPPVAVAITSTLRRPPTPVSAAAGSNRGHVMAPGAAPVVERSDTPGDDDNVNTMNKTTPEGSKPLAGGCAQLYHRFTVATTLTPSLHLVSAATGSIRGYVMASGAATGGRATLNHRLIAVTPAGVIPTLAFGGRVKVMGDAT